MNVDKITNIRIEGTKINQGMSPSKMYIQEQERSEHALMRTLDLYLAQDRSFSRSRWDIFLHDQRNHMKNGEEGKIFRLCMAYASTIIIIYSNVKGVEGYNTTGGPPDQQHSNQIYKKFTSQRQESLKL